MTNYLVYNNATLLRRLYVFFYVFSKYVFLMYFTWKDYVEPDNYKKDGLRTLLFVMFAFCLISILSLVEGLHLKEKNLVYKIKVDRYLYLLFGIPIFRHRVVTKYRDNELTIVDNRKIKYNWSCDGPIYNETDKSHWMMDIITTYLLGMQLVINYLLPQYIRNSEFLKLLQYDGYGTLYIMGSLLVVIIFFSSVHNIYLYFCNLVLLYRRRFNNNRRNIIDNYDDSIELV